MSTLHIGQKTNQGMLPQSPALESTSKDKPGVGTKRYVETVALSAVAGMQHGRGKTGNRVTCLSQPLKKASSTGHRAQTLFDGATGSDRKNGATQIE